LRGKTRFLTALEMGTPDIVPVFLRDLTLGLDESGLRTREVCAPPYDPVKSARSVLALHRRLGQDAVVGCIHYVGLDALALGGELKFPDRGIPSVVRHPLENDGWMDRIEVRGMQEEPYSSVLRSYELVSEAIGDDAEVVCNVEGPMTKAALLRGMERYAIDIHTDPDMARDVTDLSNEISLAFVEEAADRGAGTCFIAASTDNPTIFGREAFLRYSLPGVKAMTDLARKEGMRVIYHPHGTFHEDADLVSLCFGTGVQGIQFAEGNDFRALKGMCHGKGSLLGGLDIIPTLLLGPEERIESETKAFLDVCKPGGGYVFMCSCSLHRGMPIRHVEVMMNVCHQHGRY
jgi:uroporphyrinogen-III decarboxylase